MTRRDPRTEIDGSGPVAVMTLDSPRKRSSERTVAGDELPSWLLRVGLAFVFLYAGVAMILHPEAFVAYIPAFVHGSLAALLLHGFAAYELVLATALLSRRYGYLASVASVLTLASITLANLDSFDVLFRNVAIAFAAASLAVQLRRGRGAAADDRR